MYYSNTLGCSHRWEWELAQLQQLPAASSSLKCAASLGSSWLRAGVLIQKFFLGYRSWGWFQAAHSAGPS